MMDEPQDEYVDPEFSGQVTEAREFHLRHRKMREIHSFNAHLGVVGRNSGLMVGMTAPTRPRQVTSFS